MPNIVAVGDRLKTELMPILVITVGWLETCFLFSYRTDFQGILSGERKSGTLSDDPILITNNNAAVV